MVPVRFITNALGGIVWWNVEIYSPGYWDKRDIRLVCETANQELKTTEDVATLIESVALIRMHGPHKDLVAAGSGVFINSDGMLVTNYHVIEPGFTFNIIT